MPTADDYCDAARRAAPWWGIDPTDVTVLNRTENVVVRVDSVDGPAVMRLHRPGYNTIAELDSEVRWVHALGEAGIPVPTARPLLEGGHYRPVDIAGADGSTERRQVGVVEWLDGAPLGGPLDDPDPATVDQFETIGRLTGQIRAHGRSWTPPPGFVRRRWDLDGFLGDAPLWGRFWEIDELDGPHRALFSRTRDRLVDALRAMPTGPEHFGLIHADLHFGNLMVDGDIGSGGQLTVIDFDDAGFGWFAHELAVTLNSVVDEPWYDDAKHALIEGHRSVLPLGQDQVEAIDVFLAIRALMIVGWLAARPELPVHEHLPDVIADGAAACNRFLD